MYLIKEIEDIPQNKSIYLFGAGQCGSEIFEAVKKNGNIKISGFIDNNRDGFFCGIKVISPNEILKNKEEKYEIIITSQFYQDISAQLNALGIYEYYNAYPLFEAIRDRAAARKIKLMALTVTVLIGLGFLAWGVLN